MKKIFFILMLIIVHRCNHLETAQTFKIEKLKKTPTLNPIQKLQLDFLKDELTMYQKQAQTAWVNNVNVLLLVESAELLIASANDATMPIIKNKIIDLFKEIQIPIKITSNNLIQKVDTDTDLKIINKKMVDKKLVHKKKSTISAIPYRPPNLERIHGAGRTLRQIKERYKSSTIKDGKLDWQTAMEIAGKKIEKDKAQQEIAKTETDGL